MEQGYSVEILRNCWVCFDGALYKALLLVDTEDSFAMVELDKLEHDVRAFGLSILVVSDWYDEKVMTQSNYYDQNTRSEWLSVIGGSNIPAINMLLTRFGGQFGLNAYEGKFDVGNSEVSSLVHLHRILVSMVVFYMPWVNKRWYHCHVNNRVACVMYVVRWYLDQETC